MCVHMHNIYIYMHVCICACMPVCMDACMCISLPFPSCVSAFYVYAQHLFNFVAINYVGTCLYVYFTVLLAGSTCLLCVFHSIIVLSVCVPVSVKTAAAEFGLGVQWGGL